MTKYEVISYYITIADLGGIEADECAAGAMRETAGELGAGGTAVVRGPGDTSVRRSPPVIE